MSTTYKKEFITNAIDKGWTVKKHDKINNSYEFTINLKEIKKHKTHSTRSISFPYTKSDLIKIIE